MKEKPLVDRVDVVIGSKEAGDERIITVAKATADRWPDIYRPATIGGDEDATETSDSAKPARKRPTAAAKRAKDLRNAKPAPLNSPDDLPSAPDPAAATATTDTTAGEAGVTTEGVTS